MFNGNSGTKGIEKSDTSFQSDNQEMLPGGGLHLDLETEMQEEISKIEVVEL